VSAILNRVALFFLFKISRKDFTMSTVKATVRRANNTAIGKGASGTLKSFGTRTIELAPSASGTLVDFQLQIPSNVRLSAASRVYWDDLATSGSPTLDIGLYAVDANITSDDDALTDGLAISAVSTANVGAQVIKDFANSGKRAWEFVNGQTTDPGGLLAVKGIIRDAATVTNTGTITLDLYGYED
jgi:hypothetical protein